MTTTETFPVVPWASPDGSLNVDEGDMVLHKGRFATVAYAAIHDDEIVLGGHPLVWARYEGDLNQWGTLRTYEYDLGDLVAVRPRTEKEST